MEQLINLMKDICKQQKQTLSYFFNLVEVLHAKGILSNADLDYIREHNAFEENEDG